MVQILRNKQVDSSTNRTPAQADRNWIDELTDKEKTLTLERKEFWTSERHHFRSDWRGETGAAWPVRAVRFSMPSMERTSSQNWFWPE